jgi:hypothetical protein
MIINVFVDFWELGEVWQGRDSLILCMVRFGMKSLFRVWLVSVWNWNSYSERLFRLFCERWSSRVRFCDSGVWSDSVWNPYSEHLSWLIPGLGARRRDFLIRGGAKFGMKSLLRTALPVDFQAWVLQDQISWFRGVVIFCMKSLVRTALPVDSGSGCSTARFSYPGRG